MLSAVTKTISFLSAVGLTQATGGVDVSQRTYTDAWQCMKNEGNTFGIVRVYCSSGHPDENGPATINDAWSGGMSYVDGYIFPCYSCGNAAQQMDDTISYLSSNGVSLLGVKTEDSETLMSKYNGTLGATVGMLWIDVEGTQYWSSDPSSNVNFIQEMVDEGNRQGVNLGIYTSNSQWSPIAGGSTQFSMYPLWYPHYDSWASFDDFTSFGGWTKPSIKQYQGTTSDCGASVDLNYY
ncbi:unnamed protein product [Ectocarpus fasciculatus]